MIGITGGSGKTGRPLVKMLKEKGRPFRALAHSDASAKFLKSMGAEVVQGSIEDPAVVAEFMAGVDQLYLLTPMQPDNCEIEKMVIDKAVEAEVEGIVKISVYTKEQYAASCFCVWHWHNEEYLKKCGIPYTVLHPHTFFETISLSFAKQIRSEGRMTAAVQPDRGLTLVSAEDVGEVAAMLLMRGNQKNETLLLTGSQAVTFAQCAEMIGERLGKTIAYQELSPDDMHAVFVSQGFPEFLARGIVGVHIMYRMDSWPCAPVSTSIQDITGHPPRTFSDFLDENIGDFGGGMAA